MKSCVNARGQAFATIAALLAATVVVTLSPLAAAPAAAQTAIDIGGWKLVQQNSTQTETFAAGTLIQPNGYLVLARYATKAQFEAYYGVTLGSNVTYLTHTGSSTGVPQINGGETFQLFNASSISVDGPTPALPASAPAHAYHRDDPGQPPWSSIDTSPTPGSGVVAPDNTGSGVVITEVNDSTSGTNAYYYEFVELYYDVASGTGNVPPVISGTAITPSAPTYADSLVFTTTVTDADGTVASVLLWSRIGAASFTSQPMAPAGGNVYRAAIYPLTALATYDYYVEAYDDQDASSRDPSNAPGSTYSVFVQGPPAEGKLILFDHAHGQDAGTTGNWRIDDNFPYPLPANPANEAAWSGQLSSWAYELHLLGHTVKSNTTALDAATLADVDLLIIPDPQNPFTPAEIAAVGDFVLGGGSLFVIADHNSSDRDSDGWDSPSVFGGYTVPHISDPVGSDTETFCGALFGLHFHVKDEGNNGITGTFANVIADPSNPVIHGPYGTVSAVIYHVGDVMSLWPTANANLSSVGGLIWKDGDTGNPDVNIAAWSRYGQGKVMGYGDSSSFCDGTDSEAHEDDWDEAGGNNREFFLNATMWLLQNAPTSVGGGEGDGPPGMSLGLHAAPNPFNPLTRITLRLPAAGDLSVTVYDLGGRLVRTLCSGHRAAGAQTLVWDGRDNGGRAAPSGVYLLRALGCGTLECTKVLLTK
jgi:hypothetical protein